MKVLVINGSPRAKGNSDLLCDEFIRGAKESGNQVEKVSLREKEVHPCKACYACFKTGSCVQKDDMADILKKAEEADVLVLASPTYFLTMSGQMKVFIDRLLPKWQGLGGKQAYVIVTGHDGKQGLKRNAEDLTMTLENLGDHVKQVIWGEHVWQKGEVLGTKAMEEAYRAGQHINR
ncbi:MAG TPA: flavodoxin family protein [Candidatus Enterocloster faecavium]|uniref:Flavodoxin family protein n=1 Tax=Candidatus Enterocloster faecavium TaxID=2838560 RepID=A0A9D2LA54_9FIRM|nr:flavodoxin family protein [Candidatus Enterocloster faecavium]